MAAIAYWTWSFTRGYKEKFGVLDLRSLTYLNLIIAAGFK